jgi:hypothetical protein
MTTIDVKKVKEHLAYTLDGSFIRIKKTAKNTLTGVRIKESLHHTGYKQVKFFNKTVRVHQLVFIWHHSFLPKTIDHVDGNKSNNRIENLREVTLSQNAHNSKLSKKNTLGVKGLVYDKKDGIYYGMIAVKGVRKKFGYSKDKNKTIAAIEVKRKELHGEFARSK